MEIIVLFLLFGGKEDDLAFIQESAMVAPVNQKICEMGCLCHLKRRSYYPSRSLSKSAYPLNKWSYSKA